MRCDSPRFIEWHVWFPYRSNLKLNLCLHSRTRQKPWQGWRNEIENKSSSRRNCVDRFFKNLDAVSERCADCRWNFSNSSPLCRCEHKGRALKWASKLCKWIRINDAFSVAHKRQLGTTFNARKMRKLFVVIIRRFCLRNVKDADIISKNCLCGSVEAKLRSDLGAVKEIQIGSFEACPYLATHQKLRKTRKRTDSFGEDSQIPVIMLMEFRDGRPAVFLESLLKHIPTNFAPARLE